MAEPLVSVKNLVMAFSIEGRLVPVTDKVTFDINRGEILGIVGESGSGKSVTSKSIMKLIPEPPGKLLDGEILYDGRDIAHYTDAQMRAIRGNKISMIFQEPMSALNPVYTCGEQIIEAIVAHRAISRKEARARALELLRLVGISMPERRQYCYPHELSGGMRQRILIAMALGCDPDLLIADEPTTALDPTVQAQILDLIKKLQARTGMSVLYITHDLGVVAEICDRVIVMYAGKVMEVADVRELFKNPLHPYTKGLFNAMPRLDVKRKRLLSIVGNVPPFSELPAGCQFCTRCPEVMEECISERPAPISVSAGHSASCWRIHSESVREKSEANVDDRTA